MKTKKTVLEGASAMVEFEGEEISIDINTNEVTETGGWKLQPVNPPVVISNAYMLLLFSVHCNFFPAYTNTYFR